MKVLLLLFLLLVAVAIYVPLDAQKVGSRAYGIMLQRLLSHSVPEINVTDLPQNSDHLLYLDARSRGEYDISHLPQAIWVGYDDFETGRVIGIDKAAPIIVYCSVGYRSEKIAEQLIALGFGDVHNLYGGIFEWVNAGKSIENNDQQSTQRVHAYNAAWGLWLRKGEKVW